MDIDVVLNQHHVLCGMFLLCGTSYAPATDNEKLHSNTNDTEHHNHRNSKKKVNFVAETIKLFLLYIREVQRLVTYRPPLTHK